MGTKKQTMRNRLLAFAVVMVYTLALLPTFALATPHSKETITSLELKDGNGKIVKTINDFVLKQDTDLQDIILPKGTEYLVMTPTFLADHGFKTSGGVTGTGATLSANKVIITGISTADNTISIDTADTSGSDGNISVSKYEFNVRQAAETKTLSTLTAVHVGTEPTITATDFEPDLAAGITTSAITVPNKNTKLNITATATDANATVKITNNGVAVTNSATTDLVAGLNKIEIVITAEDGTKDTKTLNVTRTAADKTNKLASLSLKGIEDNAKEMITFNPDSTTYNVILDEATATFNIVGKLPADSKSKINDLTAGTDYTVGPITVVPGTTGIYTATVKPEDTNLSSTTYTINVTAPGKKNDASLKELALKQTGKRDLTFSPKFDTNTTNYKADISDMTTEMWVKKDITSDKDATVVYTINGVDVLPNAVGTETVDGVVYNKIPTPKATPATANAFTLGVKVTAQDKQTTKVYTIAVTRLPKSNNSSVKNIALSGAWTKDKFAAGTTAYTGVSAANKFEMTVTAEHPFAEIKVNGDDFVSGVAQEVTIPADKNIKVVITAENADPATAKTYTYVIEPSKDFVAPANLKLASVTETTATISYLAPTGMNKVAAYYKADGETKWVCGSVVDAKAGTITVKGLQPKTKYEIRLTAGKEIYSGQMSYIPLTQSPFVKPTTKAWYNAETVKVLSTDATSITVGYGTVGGAESYALYYKESGATKWAYAAKTGAKGGALTAKNLDSKKKYDVVVTTGKMVNGKMVYIPLASLNSVKNIELNATKLPANVKNERFGDKLVVNYTGVNGYDSYALYVAEKADGAYKYASKTANPNEIVAGGLEAGKTYYYKLTAGKLVNGKMTYTPLAEIKDVITVVVPK